MTSLGEKIRHWRYKYKLWRFDRMQLNQDLKYLHKNFLDTVVRSSTGTAAMPTSRRRVAIVAVYPNSEIIFSIRNLCAALAENGFWILVVSSTVLDDDMRESLRSSCNMLLERAPIGRDFGSYKMGVLWLKANTDISQIDKLILANDSLYWPKSFGRELSSILKRKEHWHALYESMGIFPSQYHAQSFFLVFGSRLICSKEFIQFWDDYIPKSSRTHAIQHGEIGLSKHLMQYGWKPHASYNVLRVQNELAARQISMTLPEKAKLVLVHYEGFLRQSLERAADAGKILDDDYTDKLLSSEYFLNVLAQAIAVRMQEQNPTHGVGLLCNSLFEAPLKRDIAYQCTHQIGVILQYICGFDDREKELILKDLKNKGTIRQLNRFNNFLRERGRI